MLRKAICAVAIIIGVGLGFSAAEEVKGKINKIDDKKVTTRKTFLKALRDSDGAPTLLARKGSTGKLVKVDLDLTR